MPTYRKINIKSLTAKLGNVSYSDMTNSPKGIRCMMLKTRKLYTAEMSVLMNNPRTLLLVANLSRTPIGRSQLIAMTLKMKIPMIMNTPFMSSNQLQANSPQQLRRSDRIGQPLQLIAMTLKMKIPMIMNTPFMNSNQLQANSPQQLRRSDRIGQPLYYYG
jgi:hypothetical protein